MKSSAQPLDDPTTFIDSLNTTAVRMLANAIFGAPLLSMFSYQSGLQNPLVAQGPSFERNDHQHTAIFTLTETYQQWLRQLDKQPDSLLAYLHSDRRIKLGIYHEQLWQYFLSNNDNTKLHAANLAARNNGHDLGEFDLIYEHRDYGLVHLEIASKYYLACSQQTEQWQTWLGPGKTDRLDLKLNHSINKQMNLADHPRASEQLLAHLDSMGIARPTAQQPLNKQLHIGGRLFYRQAESVTAANASMTSKPPEKLHQQHQAGQWLLLSEWQTLLKEYTVDYHLVDKPYWLDTANGNQRRLANANPDDKIATRMPEMIVYSIKALNIESRFCFIVPNDWLTM